MITAIVKMGFVGFLSVATINDFDKKTTTFTKKELCTANKTELSNNKAMVMVYQSIILSDTSRKTKNDSIKNMLQKKIEMKTNTKQYNIKS